MKIPSPPASGQQFDFREALHALGVAVLIEDVSGMVQFVNSHWEELFGMRAEEVVGHCCPEAAGDKNHPGPSRFGIETLELTFPVARTVQRHVAPIRDQNFNVIGRVVSYQDVTRRVTLERDMQRLETSRLLGEMAGDLAHDFNNIFDSIACTVYLLRMPRAAKDREWAAHLLNLLEQSVKLGAEAVALIKEYGRDYDPSFQALDLSEAVAAAIHLVEPRFSSEVHLKGRDLELRQELERGAFIQGNVTELKRVVANLLLNAVDAIPKDGAVSVRVTREQDRAILQIADTGRGIPEESLERIFDPQFTTRESGWGRGLAIVHRIVRRHGGAINVSSSGEGSTFTLSFPCH